MKLMIVDDHAGARRLIRELLAMPDVAVCECASGEEAVRIARDLKPDWITMDIHLPGLNGLNAAAAIKAVHPTAQIVIVTSDNQAYLRELARVVGAAGHVCKDNLVELRPLFAHLVAAEKSNTPALAETASANSKGGTV